MLQFIFGRPAGGKTHTVLEKIKELTQRGEQSVLIVPEQFTFESEKAVLDTMGDRSALFVKVISFTRLYDEIGRRVGGIAGSVLREADKIIFMNKTLKSVGSDLKLWGKYCNSVTFAKSILDTVGEFKINSVTPEDLKRVSLLVKGDSLRNKLQDLSLIYEGYNAMLGERFLDPADTLTAVYEKLKDYNYFAGKTVFLDSFKGFTGQQYKIMEQIFTQAENVYVSLTNDPEITEEYSVFHNIRKATLKIESLAKSRGVRVAEPMVLKGNYYKSKGISNVEQLLSGAKLPQNAEGDGVTVCRAKTLYDEVDFVAATIRRLVRTENYRYRDFVVIARDSEKYQPHIESAFKKNKINCFSDSKIPLSAFPICVAARNAVNALNFSTDAVLSFHKTGLGTLESSEISDLENYCFIWNVEGEKWLTEWDMDPRGMTNYEDRLGEARQELYRLNALRLKAVSPLLEFKNEFGNTAASMAKAIVKLFESADSAAALKKITEEFKNINNTFYADAIKQSYDAFMEILDSLVLCFGEASISKKEFADALNLAVSLESVGLIPQTLDEVTFGAADRIRPSRPKVAFILGANQGEFPKALAKVGVLSLAERRDLIANEINISDNGLEASINESFLVYSNICCPLEKLYISYNEKTVVGEVREPASFIKDITQNISCTNLCFKQELPETEAAAFSEYCRNLRVNPILADTFKQSLSKTEYWGKIQSIGKGTLKKEESLTPETAQALYGNTLRISASKVDTYSSCHFAFFCRFGLGAEGLKSADFNTLQRGTLVHYCLERLISDYKKQVADLTYDELDRLCDGYIEEYICGVAGLKGAMNTGLYFVVERISRSLKEVFHSISDEMKQSQFEPVECELKISDIKFPYSGGEIVLNGVIDRVDSFNGYVRIIDYKTGDKIFKLPEILVGLNLQMLIYLYSIVRGNRIENAKAGGILYKPSNRDIKNKGMAMNGLLPENGELLTAMERETQGIFVPKPDHKDSFIPEEDFQVIFDHIERLLFNMGEEISKGDIRVNPINGLESNACKYCEFSGVCGIENEEIPSVESMHNSDVLKLLKEGENGN